MRREAATRTFNTQAELLAHVQWLAAQAGMPCPPEAMERLAVVLSSAAQRAHQAAEAGWHERCARAGHRPRCQSADHCTQRILRRSIGPYVTLEMAREWRAAKEGR